MSGGHLGGEIFKGKRWEGKVAGIYYSHETQTCYQSTNIVCQPFKIQIQIFVNLLKRRKGVDCLSTKKIRCPKFGWGQGAQKLVSVVSRILDTMRLVRHYVLKTTRELRRNWLDFSRTNWGQKVFSMKPLSMMLI